MADANRGQFGIDAFTEEGLHEIVEILAALRDQPEVLANIKKNSDSCAHWGEILSQLRVRENCSSVLLGNKFHLGKFLRISTMAEQL